MDYNGSMLRSFSYRLYPTVEQQSLLAKSFGSVRFVYNRLLEYRNKAYERRKESRNYYDCNAFLRKLKDIHPWLRDVNSQSLQMANRNLDAAFRNFFRDPGRTGHPTFRKRSSRQSFQCPQNVKVDYRTAAVYLPRIGWIDCVFHRRFKGNVKTVTVVLEPSGRYHVRILVDTGVGDARPDTRLPASLDDVLGIDMGVKTLAVCSDGTEFENNKYLANSERKLKRLQRKVARKKKGSSNRRKAAKKLAGCHEKISNQRKDTIEKTTTDIVNKNHVAVCVEDLNTKGMMKNHRMAKAIGDASFRQFLARLEQKCIEHGILFVKVPRFYASSRICSSCGCVHKDLTLSDREWKCPVCNAVHDRDRNASVNIQKKGYEMMTIPVDGGESTPVETDMVDDRANAPKKPNVEEAGIVLGNTTQEAPCL